MSGKGSKLDAETSDKLKTLGVKIVSAIAWSRFMRSSRPAFVRWDSVEATSSM